MYNERGTQIDRASLSIPVQVTGWKTLPAAGEEVFEIDTEVILFSSSYNKSNSVQNLANRIAAQRKADNVAKKMEVDAVAVTKKHEEHLKKYRSVDFMI